LAVDRGRVLELDRPFEIGDEVIAADRAIDAGGGEIEPLHATADTGAAVIVIELRVGETRCVREGSGPGIEGHTVKSVVDLTCLRRRGDPLRTVANPVVARQHHEAAQQPGWATRGAVAQAQQQIIVAQRAQQLEPALALGWRVARRHLDADPGDGRRDIERDDESETRDESNDERARERPAALPAGERDAQPERAYERRKRGER